jgi:hypothetical protein
VSRLRLLLPTRLSSVPEIDSEATGWASLLTDTITRWANGNIGSDNIANGSITTAEVAAGTFLELEVGGTARKVAFGGGSVGWGTGNDFSQVATISHGLGGTQLSVQAVRQVVTERCDLSVRMSRNLAWASVRECHSKV